MKPTPSQGVSVLSVLYGLLFLSLAGLGGWLAWQSLGKDKQSTVSATATIGAPVKEEEAVPSAEKPSAPAQTEDLAEKKDDPAPEPTAAKEAEKQAEKPKTPPQAVEEDTASADAPQQDNEQPAQTEEPSQDTSVPTAETAIGEPEEPSEQPGDAPVDTASKDTQGPDAKPDLSATDIVKNEPKKDKQPDNRQQATKEQPKATAPADAEEEIKAKEEEEEQDSTPPTFAHRGSVEQEDPLPPVPDPELTSKSDYGLLPVISPSGKLPWRIYRKPFEDPLDRPRIAIIIGEMGMSRTATRSTIQNLPGSVTLSFNPYARDLQSWIEQARAAGHEVLLQLPMEPFGYPKNDPGPHSLLTSLTDKENLKRLEWMLGRFTGYSGVTNQMGSRFTASPDDIRPILDVVKARGLLFLDGRTSAKSVAGPLSAEIGIPVAINNRFLDHKADRATIDARLQDLERIARYTGTAVGIGYPYPVTLERITHWAQTLARKGYVLAPVSAIVNRQEIQ